MRFLKPEWPTHSRTTCSKRYSPAPNYEEACAAESRADFIHKLGICLKELRESRCWIRLIIRTELLPEQKLSELHDECNQLCNIVAQSIVTAKVNREKKR
ncbi:MAG: four helix bundle protein [Acidobacteriota bacterium]